jgi:predicted ATP-binding protein involved in virulence
MRIQSLYLSDFRGFRELRVDFPKDNNVAVFIGVNGAGKSSILDAIGLLLANFILHLTRDTSRKSERLRRAGFLLSDNDINKKSDYTVFTADLIAINSQMMWYWKMSKERNGYVKEKRDIKDTATKLYTALSADPGMSLPILAYYQALRLSPYSESKTSSKKKVYRFSQFAAFEEAFERSDLGFDAFTNWFRQQEDLENQYIVRENRDYKDPKLEVIRYAIKSFFNSLNSSTLFDDLRVVRASKEDDFTFSPTVESNLEIQKGNERLNIEQLSDGERSLLLIVADIARRLAIANPSFNTHEQVLTDGQGIVLIDEVDAHLHPQWQREIIPALKNTFGSCQFIATTHSPNVLSNLRRDSIFILEDGKIAENNPHSYGRDTNSILYEFMGVRKRPDWMQKKLDHCFHLIDEENLEEAKRVISNLQEYLGQNDPDVVRANTMLHFLDD